MQHTHNFSLIRKRWLPLEDAVREVVAYEQRFGKRHLQLACHAAFPLLLTPELLNLIRINFLDTRLVPWVAEADLLLSSLCRPRGEDVFEIEPGVREVLLVELENQFGSECLEEIAKFLWLYVQKKSNREQQPYVKRTHEWLSIAYLQPDRMVQQMKNMLEKSDTSPDASTLNLSDQILLASVMEMAAEPLSKTTLQEDYHSVLKITHKLTQELYEESPLIYDVSQQESEMKEEQEQPLGELNVSGMATVFLSHSAADQAFVTEVANALGRRGIIPLVDGYVFGAEQSFSEQIHNALQHNVTVVLFLSKQSLDSRWVQEEFREILEFEEDYKDLILPIYAGDPLELIRSHQWLAERWLNAERKRIDRLGVVIDPEEAASPHIIAETVADQIAKSVYQLLEFRTAKDVAIVIDQRGQGKRTGLYELPFNIPELLYHPTLVFRPDQGERSPIEMLVGTKWEKFRQTMAWSLSEALGSLSVKRTIRIIGDSQSSIQFFLGQYFNRTTPIFLYCYNTRYGTVFTNAIQEHQLPPGGNPYCEIVAEEQNDGLLPAKLHPGETNPTVALYIGKRQYLSAVNAHLATETSRLPLVFIETLKPGVGFQNSEQVMQLVRGVVALVSRLREQNQTRTIRLYSDLPSNVHPLLSANLTWQVIENIEFMAFCSQATAPQEKYVHLPMQAKEQTALDAFSLNTESPAYQVIQEFEKSHTPIFVMYGDTSQFTEVVNGFREYFQRKTNTLYLSINMQTGKRETVGKTLFEIMHQLLDILLDRAKNNKEHFQLFHMMLENLKKRTREGEPDDKLAEFVNFAYVCYPNLVEMLSQRKQTCIIELNHFEHVSEWDWKIGNYFIDPLLTRWIGENLHFVLFSQQNTEPRLDYGSKKEELSLQVTFYKLSAKDSLVPEKYDQSHKKIVDQAEIVRLYIDVYYPLYEDFIPRVHSIIKEFLNKTPIAVSKIAYRTKSLESLLEKIERKGFADPFRQIKDFAGIRIVTYYPDDIQKVVKILQQEFEIDERHSVYSHNEEDFGYKSIFLIASLPSSLSVLDEWRRFAELTVEIQIRTILQHAWADMSHQFDYNITDQAPTELREQLFFVSSQFKIIDKEFMKLRELAKDVAQGEKIDRISKVLPTSTHIEEIMHRYSEKRPLYEDFVLRLRHLLEALLRHTEIPFDKILYRVKSVESVLSKIQQHSYTDPFTQIKDISGIRIITYYLDDIDKVRKLIHREFDIDEEEFPSDTQGKESWEQAIHLVTSLSKPRIELEEWAKFTGLCAEIQIRTIIQQAWTDMSYVISHNKWRYSAEIQKHISYLKNLLKTIDEEFIKTRNMAEELIESYRNQLIHDKFDLPLNIDSLREFIRQKVDLRFWEQSGIKSGMEPFPQLVSQLHKIGLGILLHTLETVGISTIAEFDSLFPELEKQEEQLQRFVEQIKAQGETLHAVPVDVLTFLISFLKASAIPSNFDWGGKYEPFIVETLREICKSQPNTY